ncbi:tetratricopeptide repeat protein [Spirosoma fluviale]|uniref:Tetratricopeptide repeat-containing protein n=1 Tax=Spirosoma fluviale TaxID=1597977 RepID=A0A286F8N7_9BACT|nr:tetratricopeptide repeat protein [Spirosoma fluviale]SOD79585.1 Tetratricopeptide repeat-containing protein [Spirosoma fluviale]
MNYYLLTCLIIFCKLSVNAQNATNSVEALHFIKLGNTLRMVDRPQQAIDLVLRALPAVQSKDVYLEAVAYENLGFAYTDLENSQTALSYFYKAHNLYQKLNYGASAAAMRQLIGEMSGKDLYAGIDIGASGVKLAIFRSVYENGFYNKDIKVKPVAPNVTLVSGTAQSFKDGQDVMKAYMDSIRRYKIPADHTYIAFSSGINETLGKTPARKKKLYELFSSLMSGNPSGADSLRIDTTLTAAREAELFLIGSVPRRLWVATSCIDIGSGNTKGGYYDNGRRFHAVSLPYGTKTLANLIDGNRSLPIDAYKEEARRVIKMIADTAVNVEFNTASPGLHQRKTVAIGGGIAWAMTVYLHPEKAGTTAVPLTLSDAQRFARLVMTDYQSLIQPDLTDLADPVVRRKAEADINNVQNQFNEKQLIAGALLLESVFRAYANTSVPKRFVFIRDSDISWVAGKFLETLNQNYEQAVVKSAR